jgi:LmbE family N-acetylglucosaminyl deacetylase
MRIQSIHAHFDDFEFVASGLFSLWRQKPDLHLKSQVVVCTDGKAGHHTRPREETMQIRIKEQQAAARVGEFDFQMLTYYNGTVPREACLQVTIPLLAALWKAIRDFQPNYLFCPPIPSDPRAGIHVDHVAVSEAVRKVAYMINVPHAFTLEYPDDEKRSEQCPVPVILTVYDGYMAGANAYDLAVDVEDVFDWICKMTWCHQSQIAEWLPWVGRHEMTAPLNIEEWRVALRKRFQKRNREMGIQSERIHEFFTVTAWGTVPILDQILQDFPGISKNFSNLAALDKRLQQWRGES